MALLTAHWLLLSYGTREETPQSQTRGVTLLELMIVFSIIGMLASLAMPLWYKATDQAHLNFCIHNQRKIYEAVSLYELEHAQTLHSIKNYGVTVRTALSNAGYVKVLTGPSKRTSIVLQARSSSTMITAWRIIVRR